MADKNCPLCQGHGRIPWPEAGMMQDCACVRRAQEPAQHSLPFVLGGVYPHARAGWSGRVHAIDYDAQQLLVSQANDNRPDPAKGWYPFTSFTTAPGTGPRSP